MNLFLLIFLTVAIYFVRQNQGRKCGLSVGKDTRQDFLFVDGGGGKGGGGGCSRVSFAPCSDSRQGGVLQRFTRPHGYVGWNVLAQNILVPLVETQAHSARDTNPGPVFTPKVHTTYNIHAQKNNNQTLAVWYRGSVTIAHPGLGYNFLFGLRYCFL